MLCYINTLTFWRANKVKKLSALVHVTFFILRFENTFYNRPV